MKKLFTTVVFVLGAVVSLNAQQSWTTNPLEVDPDKNGTIGTKNQRSLFLVSNDTTRIAIDSLGNVRMNSLQGTDGLGFVLANSNGVLTRAPGGGGGAFTCGTSATPWLLGGNTVPGNTNANVIGPCNLKDFILQANSKKSLFITTSGLIGVGENNSSPAAVLDIFDPNALGNNIPNVDHLRIYGDEMGTIESTNSMSMLYNNDFFVVKGQVGGTWQPQLRIDGSGHLGLGTGVGALTYKFTVEAGSMNGILHRTSSSTSQAFSVFNSNSNQNTFSIFGDGKTQVGWQTGTTNSAQLNINVNGNSTAAVNAIDVFDQYTNAVNFRVKSDGGIFCRELNVQSLAFPDYVFDKNYNLIPLMELKDFISENQHLPGVPTAKEIAAHGANLGDLNKIQMEKIEELTLYVIQLKEELDSMKKKFETQH